MTLEEIRGHITTLSGSGKRVVSTRRHGIYSTFTLPGLDDMPGVRDTRQRFADFFVDQDLTGKTFLDLGANVGAMSFEAARRGAVVTGVEYRDDRVWLMQSIANHFGFSNATFVQADFNDPGWVKPIFGQQYDIVLCSSVDEYIDDVLRFYETIWAFTREVCYFESNIQRGVTETETIAALEAAGFKTVEYLGNGHSGGISRKRKLYRAKP